MMKLSQLFQMVGLGAFLATAAACGGGDQAEGASGSQAAAPEAGAPAADVPTTGNVIEVKMLTDDQGNNIFEPAEITAKKGDVLRYTLVSGVHNVNFLQEKNPGITGLPPASPMLQLPGQTHDVTVTMDPGKYYFQCDPHAALGMIGYLTVTE